MDRKNIETIFAASPTQQALLLHCVQAGRQDPGIIQLECTLGGDLHEETFKKAWRYVVGRHPALRSAVFWENVEAPLQVVFKQVDLAWTIRDWRGLTREEADRSLDAFLLEDLELGLDLSTAPVMRLALIRLQDERRRLIWTCHHVLLDGWSGAAVLRDVTTVYDALRSGSEPQLPAAPSYQAYVRWLQQQDSGAAESYWRGILDGVTTPTPLPGGRSSNGAGGSTLIHDEEEIRLSVGVTTAIADLARSLSVTAGTLFHAAWALLLSEFSGRADVVLGATVSGRAIDLPGVDMIVGLCSNTVPVRVRIDSTASIRAFLSQLHKDLAILRQYEHVPASFVQAWSSVPPTRRLFESLLVVENFTLPTDQRHLTISDFRGPVTTSYPLTVIVEPGKELVLKILYDTRRYEHPSIVHILERLRRILEALATHVDGLVQDTAPTAFSGRESDFSQPPTESPAVGMGARPENVELVPPADDIERRLVGLWEDVLEIRPIGVQDDFFDMGGQSVMAAHLFERIEREVGVKLPLAALFELSTIRKLSGALREQGWSDAWSPLVRIRASGSRPPLFCMHSWAGNVLFYRDFARHLGADQPVYGLQAIGLDGTTPPLNRIEDMAEQFLAEIRQVQPHGPYSLLGMCFGNAVALEAAYQLHAVGERVSSLFILDSGIPLADSNRPDLNDYAQRFASKARDGHLLTAVPGFINRKARKKVKACSAAMRRAKRSLAARFGSQSELHRFNGALESAWKAYVPKVVPGRITFIRSEERATDSRYDYEVGRWIERAAGGVDVRVVPGEHLTLLNEPYVRDLAATVQECLNAAQPVEPIAT